MCPLVILAQSIHFRPLGRKNLDCVRCDGFFSCPENKQDSPSCASKVVVVDDDGDACCLHECSNGLNGLSGDVSARKFKGLDKPRVSKTDCVSNKPRSVLRICNPLTEVGIPDRLPLLFSCLDDLVVPMLDRWASSFPGLWMGPP